MLLLAGLILLLVDAARAFSSPRRATNVAIANRINRLFSSTSSNDAAGAPSVDLLEPGTEKPFFLKLEGPPLKEELTDENLVKIVKLETSDEECNYICWKCLGYRYDTDSKTFKLSEEVFPKWAKKYPEPCDVIGITREYGDDTDRPVRNANMDLMRSVPRDFKGGVRQLTKVGFKLFKIKELTPNKTRRAQLVNWLIYYRESLFGKSLDQLIAEREAKQATEAANASEDEASPSEKMFQKKRLDERAD
jgi:hypothetical protein